MWSLIKDITSGLLYIIAFVTAVYFKNFLFWVAVYITTFIVLFGIFTVVYVKLDDKYKFPPFFSLRWKSKIWKQENSVPTVGTVFETPEYEIDEYLLKSLYTFKALKEKEISKIDSSNVDLMETKLSELRVLKMDIVLHKVLSSRAKKEELRKKSEEDNKNN